MAAGLGIGWGISWGSITLAAKAILDYLTFKLNFNTISTDFTFTRNSFATRVNEFGLIETVTDLGSDLVQNGSFDELGSELVANGNFDELGPELITSGNEATDVVALADNQNVIIQPSFITIGKTYEINFEVYDYVEGSIYLLRPTDLGVGTAISANGTYSYTVEADASTSLIFRTDGVSTTLKLRNISVKQVDPNDDWTKLNATISDGKGNLDGDGQTSLLYQDILTNGKTYKITFTVSNYNSLGNSEIINTNGGNIFTIPSNGTFTVYFTHSIADGNIYWRAISGAIYSIDNVSVKQVDPNDDWEQFGVGITITDKANFDGSGTTVNFRQVGVVTAAKTYKVTYTVGDYSQGSLSMRVGGTYGTARTANGTYTDTLTTANGNFQIYGFSNFIGSIDNIIAKEVLEDDVPRIDYTGSTFDVPVYGDELLTDGVISNAGGGSFTFTANGVHGVSDGTSGTILRPRLLWSSLTVGKQYRIIGTPTVNSGTTNYAVYNGSSYEKNQVAVESFDITFTCNGSNVFFTNDGTQVFDINWDLSIKEVTAYTTTDKGAFLLEPISTNSVDYSEDFSNIYWTKLGTPTITDNYGTSPDGTQNSTRVQGNSLTTIYVSNGAANTNFSRSIYIKATSGSGTIQTLSHNSNTNNVFSIDENWQRVEINSLTSSTGDVVVYAIDMRGASTDIFDVEIWGCQEERGIDYATSYIPTSGTTVTRAQESCVDATPTINSEEGVLYLEASALTETDSLDRVISINKNGLDEWAVSIKLTSVGEISYLIKENNVKKLEVFTTGVDVVLNNKIAILYKSGESKAYLNGVQIGSTSTSTFTDLELDSLTFDRGDGNRKFYGRTKDLRIYDKALTDDELTELTTI
jgi:hypothetical protein